MLTSFSAILEVLIKEKLHPRRLSSDALQLIMACVLTIILLAFAVLVAVASEV